MVRLVNEEHKGRHVNICLTVKWHGDLYPDGPVYKCSDEEGDTSSNARSMIKRYNQFRNQTRALPGH